MIYKKIEDLYNVTNKPKYKIGNKFIFVRFEHKKLCNNVELSNSEFIDFIKSNMYNDLRLYNCEKYIYTYYKELEYKIDDDYFISYIILSYDKIENDFIEIIKKYKLSKKENLDEFIIREYRDKKLEKILNENK